ncbi:MAG: hypothetical protein IT440_09520, partial [Phycisphaeraceae bacterium]|nr:hypothetical protein [Phycisphaeraceae bacterium]
HFGGAPGLTYLLQTFAPQLRAAGVAQARIDDIFVHNPAAAFAMSGADNNKRSRS